MRRSVTRNLLRAARTSLIAFACVLSGTTAYAQAGSGGPALTVEQEALVDDLTHSLVSPCCWTSSVAEHGSGQAPVLKAEIRQMVADGMTREAIIQHYLDKFGERILVEPRRQGFNVLAYWIPWLAVLGGAVAIVIFVKRRHPTDEPQLATSTPTGSDPYHRRVREELHRLDD